MGQRAGCFEKRSFPDTDATIPFQHVSSVLVVRYCHLVIQNTVKPCRKRFLNSFFSHAPATEPPAVVQQASRMVTDFDVVAMTRFPVLQTSFLPISPGLVSRRPLKRFTAATEVGDQNPAVILGIFSAQSAHFLAGSFTNPRGYFTGAVEFGNVMVWWA